MKLLDEERITLKNEYGAEVEIYRGKNIFGEDIVNLELIISGLITPLSFLKIKELNLFLKGLGFKETIENHFNLVEFLEENVSCVDFITGEKNYYIYYDEYNKTFSYDFLCLDNHIGVVHLDSADFNYIIKELNNKKVTPKELKEAYKKLGWI